MDEYTTVLVYCKLYFFYKTVHMYTFGKVSGVVRKHQILWVQILMWILT